MKQQRTRHLTCALAATILPLSSLQAGEGVYEELGDILFPSNSGTPTYASPTSILPVTVQDFAKNPWDLPDINQIEYFVALTLGYSGNINYEPFNPVSSSYYQGHLGIRGLWRNGPTSLGYEIGATGTRYNDGIEREGHDKSFYDFATSLRLRHDINPSTTLYQNTRIHYGAHGSLEENFIFPGVQQKDAINWRSTTQLAWRTDGLSEHAVGWQQRSNFFYGGFNQDHDNWNDSYRIGFRHQAEYITSPGNGWFGSAEYGMRDFKEMNDYNSDSFRVGVGRFGRLPCGAHYRVTGGLHHLEYDNSYYDERDEIFFNGTIYGTLASVQYRIFFNHGIHHDLVNWGGGNFVDPVGTKAGLALSFQATDKVRVGATFSGQHLEADSSQSAMGELSFYTAGLGITYEYNDSTELTLNTGLHRAQFSNSGPGSSDTFGTVNFGLRLRY